MRDIDGMTGARREARRAQSPIDRGLSLRDWDRFSPETFHAALDDAWQGEAFDVLYAVTFATGPQMPTLPGAVADRLATALDAEVNRGAAWLADWGAQFADE